MEGRTEPSGISTSIHECPETESLGKDPKSEEDVPLLAVSLLEQFSQQKSEEELYIGRQR